MTGPAAMRLGQDRRAPSWARCWVGCRPGSSVSTTCWCSRTRTPMSRTSCTTWARTSWRSRRSHSFPPEQFRMWVALHEVTHRTQFTGVPWLRAALPVAGRPAWSAWPIQIRVGSSPPWVGSPRASAPGATRSTTVASRRCSPARNNGRSMDRVGGLMSLLEGHGDVTMDRAALARVPQADRFAKRAAGPAQGDGHWPPRLLQRLIGLEAKLNQYEQGEQFIAAVEEVGGPPLLNRAFESPENLPTQSEIIDPDAWLRRVAGAQPSEREPAGLRPHRSSRVPRCSRRVRLLARCDFPEGPLDVAVSGGPDSTALLALAVVPPVAGWWPTTSTTP